MITGDCGGNRLSWGAGQLEGTQGLNSEVDRVWGNLEVTSGVDKIKIFQGLPVSFFQDIPAADLVLPWNSSISGRCLDFCFSRLKTHCDHFCFSPHLFFDRRLF